MTKVKNNIIIILSYRYKQNKLDIPKANMKHLHTQHF